jgi:DNA-binding NarL/FixJ family response regulator
MTGKKSGRGTKAHTQILVVDDHPIMRQGLAQLISLAPDLAICCEAESAKAALAALDVKTPDLVLMDISLPDKNGLELIKDIQAMHPGLAVLVISMHDESLYAERVLRAGGRGYIMKQEGGKKLMQAIRQVLSGQIYVSEKMSARILELFSGRHLRGDHSPIEALTDREFEVFQLVGQGKPTREIAQLLHLSPKTVEAHRANIKEKTKQKTALDLVRFAIRWIETQNAG